MYLAEVTRAGWIFKIDVACVQAIRKRGALLLASTAQWE